MEQWNNDKKEKKGGRTSHYNIMTGLRGTEEDSVLVMGQNNDNERYARQHETHLGERA